jgi:hypothetical protein
MGCPRSCGFCTSTEANTPTTEFNEGRNDKVPKGKDEPSTDVHVDDPSKKGGFVQITRAEYDMLDKRKQRPLYFKRNDDITAVAPLVISKTRGDRGGRSELENNVDDSPSWSPYWWSFEGGGWEEGVGHACDVCDCLTAPRFVQCFDRGLSEDNFPGMLEGECTESDGDTGAVCGEGVNPDPARNKYGARFPTEIYTRGCHWIPHMFA